MAASDDLFQLIKALAPSEKRYFKVFASRHASAEDTSYFQLFEEIDRMEQYDEELLRKKLNRKKKNQSLLKYLPAEKKVLQDLIMRAMRNFHGEKTVDVQLNELLTDEIFYHGKSLYELQAKTLYKAKKLAEEYEKFPVLLTILQREAKMLIERKTKDYDEVRSRVHKEERELLEKIMNESELRLIKDDLFIDTRAGVNIRDTNFQQQLDERAKTLLVKSEKDAHSFHARIYYHSAMRAYYRLKSNMMKAWEHSRSIVELYEANAAVKNEYSLQYKIALANYLGACHVTQQYNEFEAALKKLKTTPVKSVDEEGEVFQDATMYELLYYMNTGKFEEAVKAIPDIEKGMKLYAAKLNKGSEIAIYYNITVLFFVLEEWKQAMHWVTKIIDDKSDSRKDLQHFARILQLIYYYETGKGDAMEYYTRAAYRYLEKEQNLMSFEKLMISFLKKLPFALSEKELLKSFTALKEEIERLKNTPGEKTRAGMEEMTIWLTSKIGKRKIKDVMKE
ncbi:MAG: hypothetical protein POELPBGB_02435 [Bacteroidia bacterium]|nr:hypothetical protein [Bacteroidia bacterium]